MTKERRTSPAKREIELRDRLMKSKAMLAEAVDRNRGGIFLGTILLGASIFVENPISVVCFAAAIAGGFILAAHNRAAIGLATEIERIQAALR